MSIETVPARIPSRSRAAIDEIARRTGRDFSTVAGEMLDEAVRMRRIPGIVFADNRGGRVPRIDGTGLEVFEIIGQYRAVDEDWTLLKQEFPTLSDSQLRAALAYAEAYPEEVDARLRAEEQWTPEHVWSTYPFTKPPWR